MIRRALPTLPGTLLGRLTAAACTLFAVGAVIATTVGDQLPPAARWALAVTIDGSLIAVGLCGAAALARHADAERRRDRSAIPR